MYYLDKAVQDKKVAKSSKILLYLNTLCYHVKWSKSPSVGTRPRMLLCMWLMYGDISMTPNKLTRYFSPDPFLPLVQLVALVAEWGLGREGLLNHFLIWSRITSLHCHIDLKMSFVYTS